MRCHTRKMVTTTITMAMAATVGLIDMAAV